MMIIPLPFVLHGVYPINDEYATFVVSVTVGFVKDEDVECTTLTRHVVCRTEAMADRYEISKDGKRAHVAVYAGDRVLANSYLTAEHYFAGSL